MIKLGESLPTFLCRVSPRIEADPEVTFKPCTVARPFSYISLLILWGFKSCVSGEDTLLKKGEDEIMLSEEHIVLGMKNDCRSNISGSG